MQKFPQVAKYVLQKEHMKKRGGVKCYQCDTCEEKFTTTANLSGPQKSDNMQKFSKVEDEDVFMLEIDEDIIMEEVDEDEDVIMEEIDEDVDIEDVSQAMSRLSL